MNDKDTAMDTLDETPLLDQLLRDGLTDRDTIRQITGHPLYSRVRPYLTHRMTMRNRSRNVEPIERYDYDMEPAWMILFSPRFGGRWFTLDQRIRLLADATPLHWRFALESMRRVFVSVHVRGGSKEFGCNQEYHHLFASALNALDAGGPELLDIFLHLATLVPDTGGRLHVTPDGFDVTYPNTTSH
ncbi:hypothetical protein [Bifidobacterium miconisargentati]|uniref:hypothetical protein n=1 Tax=Bifidobacterium miconisargentati TaxID=2834437 RepID=UPI001BDC146A|nr:hypothetical protein [Bifidobacterium miconisargentati]MBW3090053.1 hypothetical protein [Bifidobacterium miconisargentati]